MLILNALFVFFAIGLLGYAMAGWVHLRQQAAFDIRARLDLMAGPGRERDGAPLLKDQRLSSISFLNALLGRTPLVVPMVTMIRQAGLRRRVGEILLYVPLLGGAVLLGSQALGGSFAIGLVLAFVAGSLPLFVVARMRAKRTLLFQEQLPEALDLMRSALQAGHGLAGAMSVASEAFPDPVSYELRYAVEEQRLGLPLRDSLYNLAERVPDPNLQILAVGILVAQDSGGNLAEVLDNVAYTIRERFKLMREMRTMTAQGRLSGLVLTSLPFIVAVLMGMTNPEYTRPLLETETGNYMIAYALVSILIGHLMIRRIVSFKV